MLLRSHLNRGSLVPYFCDEYIKICGNEVLAVHTAKGATILAQWLDNNPDGARRYGKMLEKIRAAMKKPVTLTESISYGSRAKVMPGQKQTACHTLKV